MPFQKGNKVAVGRPRGCRDKFRPDVAQMFKEWNFNPLLNLKIMAETSEDEDIRFGCNKELAQYFAPKLKSVEYTGDSNPLNFNINIQKNNDESNNLHGDENRE